MLRGTWVYRDGEMVEKGGPKDVRPIPPRSAFPCPRVIRDEIAPLQSMVDGRWFDSKSAMRASYREQGYREVGNDVELTPRDNSRNVSARDDVEKAVAMFKQGYRPDALPTTILPPEAYEP